MADSGTILLSPDAGRAAKPAQTCPAGRLGARMEEDRVFGRRAADKEHADRVTVTTRWVKGGISISLLTLISMIGLAFRIGNDVGTIREQHIQLLARMDRVESILLRADRR